MIYVVVDNMWNFLLEMRDTIILLYSVYSFFESKITSGRRSNFLLYSFQKNMFMNLLENKASINLLSFIWSIG